MKKVFEQILDIGTNTFTVRATNVSMGEMAVVDRRDGNRVMGSVVSIDKDVATVQVMGSTRGLFVTDRVTFLHKLMSTKIGSGLLGRILDPLGEPIDGGPPVEGPEHEIRTQTVNPTKRIIPERQIMTNIPMIDLFNCLVESQKIPIFSIAGEPYNELLMRINNQSDADIVIVGGMGFRTDDLFKFMKNAKEHGSLEKTVMFVHKATGYPVECLMVPDMALTVAEQFAQEGKRVLVLLTDMTVFADALKEISISLDQIPSNRGYPGSLYSYLAYRYEKAVDIDGSGSITIIAVTTMPGDDVTHPVPDNTGYITEGQFYLKNGVINPFGSLSRLKQNVIAHNRDDHGPIMNAMIRLYSEALKSRELHSMGFQPSQWDEKLLHYAEMFEEKMMDLKVNIPLEQALSLGWSILEECFEKEEVGIKEEIVNKYWKSQDTQHG